MRKRLVPIALALPLAAFPAAARADSNGGLAAPSGSVSAGSTGGTAYGGAPLPPPPAPPVQQAPPAPTGSARLIGTLARAPHGAPRTVRLAIAAANRLQSFPYRFGGGHAKFEDTAYDCSGTVSFMLHGAGLLASPLDSGSLMSWGLPGPGRWITVYANAGHAYAVVAGLRLDTSGAPSGPRWRALPRSAASFVARHPAGL